MTTWLDALIEALELDDMAALGDAANVALAVIGAIVLWWLP